MRIVVFLFAIGTRAALGSRVREIERDQSGLWPPPPRLWIAWL